MCIVDTYSPRSLMATLLPSGTVRQMNVVASSQQAVLLSTYGAGCELVPPISPLNTLLALGAGDDETKGSGEPSGKQSHPMQGCIISPPILL